MQVGIDVKCMHTNFGGCDFFGFGDMATQTREICLSFTSNREEERGRETE